MIANTKTVAFLLFTLCSIASSVVNGQAISIKTPSPTTISATKAPTMTPTTSKAPSMIVDRVSGGKGFKLSKKTKSPVYSAYGKGSKLTASGKGGKTHAPVVGKAGKGGKGMTSAPVVALP